jgi:hypothetical protein
MSEPPNADLLCSSVPLNLDTTRALRTNDELRALAEAVRDAPVGEPETDGVEWKGPWDLTDAKTRFETARHVLGFGNRTTVAAELAFEGCAYLLAGVEPGNLVGTAVIDPAALDDALSKYVLSGSPRWHPSYVELDGQQILVLTIEAPRDGDPMFTLQKTYENAKAGRVFVRRNGKTVEAEPGEIRALEARRLSERPKVELAVERTDATPLHAVGFTTEAAERFARKEHDRLLAPLQPPPERSVSGFTGIMHVQELTRIQEPVSFAMSGDRRSKDEFRQEVEDYVSEPRALYRAVLTEAAIETRVAVLRLAVANPTARNFEGVQVEATFPAGVFVSLYEHEVRAALDVPDRPEVWGERTFAIAAARELRGVQPRIVTHRVERGEATTICFAAVHVRPGTPAPLSEVHLFIPPQYAGEQLPVRWRLTSTSADSWRDGEFALEIDSEMRIPKLAVPGA